MKKQQRYLYYLDAKDGEITVISSIFPGRTFDEITYSKFKYGDGKIAIQYSLALCDLLVNSNILIANEPVFVSGSAYDTVPTAATNIAESLLTALKVNGRCAIPLRIHCNAYTGDYGAMDTETRASVLAGNGLRIDRAIAQQLQGKKLIIVDDIRITGNHETALERLFRQCVFDIFKKTVYER